MEHAALGDIELVLPASTALIRLARLVASGVAVQASLDVVVDDHRVRFDGDIVTFWIRKQRRST